MLALESRGAPSESLGRTAQSSLSPRDLPPPPTHVPVPQHNEGTYLPIPSRDLKHITQVDSGQATGHTSMVSFAALLMLLVMPLVVLLITLWGFVLST